MKFRNVARMGALALIGFGLVSMPSLESKSTFVNEKKINLGVVSATAAPCVREENSMARDILREKLRAEVHGYLNTLAKNEGYNFTFYTLVDNDNGKIGLYKGPTLKLIVSIEGYGMGDDEVVFGISKSNTGFDDIDYLSIKSVDGGKPIPKHEWNTKRYSLENKMDEILEKARLRLREDANKALQEREENLRPALERLENLYIPKQ